MTAHFPGLVQAQKQTSSEVKLALWAQNFPS